MPRSRLAQVCGAVGRRAGRAAARGRGLLSAALVGRSDPGAQFWTEAVLNGAAGEIVTSRYRPALAALDSNAVGVCELVDAEVGRLWMPRFDRFMRPAIRSSGEWEPEESAFLRQRVGAGSIVVNIGANVGYTTLLMARLVGEAGRVIAIEPEPLNFQCLCANIRLNGLRNVVPIHAAAGDRTGSIQLAYSPDNAGDHRTVNHPLAVGKLTVPLVALDDLVPESVDVRAVMCDAQGYDHRVLAGMRTLLDRCRPSMLIEFWPPGILEAGDDPYEVIAEYLSWGYQMSVVTTGTDVTHSSPGDIVAIALDGRDHVTLGMTP